jgi:hypothetical protein
MRRGPVIGAALAVAAAALLVAVQPIREPWWQWADPDGAYVGSSLNILLGNHTNYLDHPGLPTQDVLALAFGAEFVVGKATGSNDNRESFADEKFLDLDRTRPLYRSWAVLLFLASTLLVYLLVCRLLGHWLWGLTGGLLFASAPGLAPVSFLLRPDAALAALCVAIGYLTATGFERRSPARYTAAAALLGLALTVKIPALAMALPLAVAVVWRPPDSPWLRSSASALAASARKHAFWLLPTAIAWVVLCWLFNRERLPIVQTDEQRNLLVNGAVFVAGYALLSLLAERLRIPWADRVFRLFYAWLVVAFVVGLFLPASLVLDDGVQMLVSIKQTLTGGRVNEGIEPFEEFTVDPFLHFPLAGAAIVIALGVVAGIVALVERRHWPFLLALGTLALTTMAAARYSYDYYYAPGFVVAIPGALWLFARFGRQAAFVAVLPALALYASTLADARGAGPEVETDAAAQELADELLKPGEVVLVPSYYFAVEDVRFGSLVDDFVDYVPEYPYRFLSQPDVAAERGLTPAYYVDRERDLPHDGRAEVDIGGYGPYVVETLPRRWGPGDKYGVARILESPSLEN